MDNFKRLNNLIGWLVFAIAAVVFVLCIEETGSFWDCGEFIAAAYKLQVGHPPGAALFLVMGRIASLFAGGNVELVPVTVNVMSAISSAFAVLFLFWTISLLARKLFKKNENGGYTGAQTLTIMGSAAVGALAYTFCDSFWFSAVEGEVYAMSQFFTALVFWAMLKWESVANERHADRWIILIAYLMGLSIGVHLLNLLCIPALAFIYYFKKYKVSRTGIFATAGIGILILVIVQYGIIAGFIKIGAYFDLLFVNSFGMPFWSGFIIFIVLIAAAVVWGLIYTKRTNRPIWNTAILCISFIMVGYSSFAMTAIRSVANPPMDENDPENAFNLLSYINREQYGDRPLGFGQHYNAQIIRQDDGAMTYTALDGKYVETGRKLVPVYEPAKTTIFPRMYSAQPNHVRVYKEWTNIQGDATPTMGQNIKFFFSYQMGWMYLRYFMWNFAGRQNDLQGHGGILRGNWLSGVDFIDRMRLGPQESLPGSMTNNAAYNRFYFLPLILGLLGMFFHFKRDRHDAFIVMLLFIMTGIAIVVYLNQYPLQPRERDYAYAGSFYAFTIWIGLAVAAIGEWLSKKVKPAAAVSMATAACILTGPVLMASEGWDDHDRSHTFTSRDFAANYLNSCAPNAVIFTNGDNDTFPLWYAQEVEGIRTDVRVVNLSLLNTDWYIDQMKRKAYDSEPVPFSWEHRQYVQGTRDYVPYYDRKIKQRINLAEVMEFIKSDSPSAKATTAGGNDVNYFPTKKFTVPVDREAVIRNGVVAAEDIPRILPSIEFDVTKNYLLKADLMILDLVAFNDWTRPIYFAVTVGDDNYMNLQEYFQLEGLAYRLVPIRTPQSNSGQTGRVNTEVMYDNMMNDFRWGNMNDPRVYLNQNNQNMAMNFRNNFARLAESLLDEGKRDSSLSVLDKCLEVMPDKTVPFNLFVLRIADGYYDAAKYDVNTGTPIVPITPELERRDKSVSHAISMGNAVVNRLADITEDDLHYFLSLKGTKWHKGIERDMNQSMAVFQELYRMAQKANQDSLASDLERRFAVLSQRYNQ